MEEEEGEIRLELVRSGPEDSDVQPAKKICLICATDVTDTSINVSISADEHNDQRDRERLKTVCTTLQLGNSEKILQKVDQDEEMRHQIMFCQNCLTNLDEFTNLQNQLTALSLQINQVRETVCNAFAEAANSTKSEALADGSGLRQDILAELYSDIKQEVIVSDDVGAYLDSPSPAYADLFLDNDDENEEEWKPDEYFEPIAHCKTKSQRPRRASRKRRFDRLLSDDDSSHLTKPCEVRVTRLDCDNGTETKVSRRSKLDRLILSHKNKLRRKSSKKRITELKRKWEAVVKSEPADSDDFFSPNVPPPKIKKEKKFASANRSTELCPIGGCEEEFIRKGHVGFHLRQVHEGLPKPFNCLACESEFETHLELKRHIRTEHEVNRNTKKKLDSGTHGRRTGTVNCVKCTQNFNCYQDLVMHYRRQGGQCTKEPLPDNCTVSLETLEDGRKLKMFNCGSCDKTFKRRYLLDIHIKGNHMGTHPYLCEICCKPFKREKSLHMHQRLSHPEEYMQTYNIDQQKFIDEAKSRHCDICNKTFTNARSRKVHEMFHSQQYLFRCETCGFGCASKRNLEMHQLKHTNPRHFSCTKCDFRFNRYDKLKRHLYRVHQVGDTKKTMVCEFCSKSFWDKFSLGRHQRIMHREHIPKEAVEEFECKICKYRCPDKGYLGIHLKTKKHKKLAEAVRMKGQIVDFQDDSDQPPLLLPAI